MMLRLAKVWMVSNGLLRIVPGWNEGYGTFIGNFLPDLGAAVSLDNRTVDEDRAVFSFFGERIKDPLPDAALIPYVVTILHRCSRTISLRQVTPWYLRSKNIKNAI
jgi:hypothetical protein